MVESRALSQCVLAAWLIPTVAVASFVTDTVAPEYPSGTGLARDPAGVFHVAYFVSGGQFDVKFGSLEAGVWTVDVVDSGGVFGSGVDLALDAAGGPHLSYATNGPWYATRIGGVWVAEQIEPASINSGTAVRVDSQGRPHVVYAGGTGLRHAVKEGGLWSIEIVDSVACSVGALALDSQDRAHIGYSYAAGPLRYAVQNGGGWTREPVDETPGAYFDPPSLALDVLGRPHLSYMANDPDYDQRYAVRDQGLWQHEVVDSIGLVGWYNSIALTTADEPRIAYTGAGDELLFAERSAGVWSIETVNATSGLGQYNSLILDAAGNPWISYGDFPGGRVALAYRGEVVSSPDSPAVSSGLVLASLFPNPARGGQVTFRFSVPRRESVRISIHDVAGRRIASRPDAVVGPGDHAWSCRIADLPAGVYYVRLVTESGATAHRRWVRLR